MQCSKCGTFTQPGMAFCPECGTPVSGVPSQYDPTVATPSPYDPTIAAPPSYGGQAYPHSSSQTPAPPAYTGYGAPPANPYAPPPPPNAYGAGQQNAYGTPSPPNAYGTPYAPPPGTFAPPSRPDQQQPPRRKGPNIWLIIGIVVLVLALVGGGALALRGLNKNTGTTPSATATSSTNNTTPAAPSPTAAATNTSTTNQGPSPSGSPIDPTSAGIIMNVQTATGVDSNILPTGVTSQFSPKQTVYVTFNLTLPQSGYVEAKLYSDTTYIGNKVLQTTMGQVDHGYFTVVINRASTGFVELYWCTMTNCSDASLGAIATFTVA